MNCIDLTVKDQKHASRRDRKRRSFPIRTKTDYHVRKVLPISSGLESGRGESLNTYQSFVMLFVLTAIVLLIVGPVFNAIADLLIELKRYSTSEFLAAMSGTTFQTDKLIP